MTKGEELFLGMILIGVVIVLGYYGFKWLLEYIASKGKDR